MNKVIFVYLLLSGVLSAQTSYEPVRKKMPGSFLTEPLVIPSGKAIALVSGNGLLLPGSVPIQTALDSKLAVAAAATTYEPILSAGTTGQYYRGDKSWQPLNAIAVGLGSVENTALSTWSGSTNVTTLGTVSAGAIPTTLLTGTITNSQLAGSIALSKLAITGTPDGTKYLRDDGAWQTISLAGYQTTAGTLALAGFGAITGTLTPNNVAGTAAILTGNAFIGANTITLSALGPTPTAAHSLINSTAAAAGAQQVSPSLLWRSHGWKTNAPAASQTVDFLSYVLPVQGSTAPTGSLKIQASINGAAFSDVLTVKSNGQIVGGAAGSATPTFATPNGHGFGDNGGNGLTIIMSGTQVMDFANNLTGLPYGSGTLMFGRFAGYGTDANSPLLFRVANNVMAFSNGTNAQTLLVTNTYTSATSYEAVGMWWNSNVAYVGTQKGIGGGSARDVSLVRGSTVKEIIGANTNDDAQPRKLPSYTVAGLPSAATCGAGSMAFVTDAAATTAYSVVAGGGSNKVLVISDGTDWIIH